MPTLYNNSYDHCFPFSDTGAMITLVANTAVTYTVPGSIGTTYRLHFSVNSNADVWARLNGTAIAPTSGTVTTLYNQERVDNNFSRFVKGGDTISLISTSTPQVGLSLLTVQQ
jgi:hypothetical protein